MCVWLFVSVWPCDGLATCPGSTSPDDRWDPTDGLSWYRKWMDGWMDGWIDPWGTPQVIAI